MEESNNSRNTERSQTTLSPILAGPILRAVDSRSITFWLITSAQYPFDILLEDINKKSYIDSESDSVEQVFVKVGERAYIVILTIHTKEDLVANQRYYYDLIFELDGVQKGLAQLVDKIIYDGQRSPSFVYQKEIKNLLHGSCRKPHHKSKDGLLAVDRILEKSFEQPELQPAMLIMSGDQVYIDDVAGPTLHAIHQVIQRLGLFHTSLPIDDFENSEQLQTNQYSYYQRTLLLPDDEANEAVISQFFGGKKKPIFTSVNANNHLITFSEVIAMYTLVWSPEMWRDIDFKQHNIPQEFIRRYENELEHIEDFVKGLWQVRRALAHVPVYMMFDDHDVTDDWNLTRGWEDAVYNNAFAKRIVGNALIGYWLCQGWGNDPKRIEPLNRTLMPHLNESGIEQHDELIDKLIEWDQWHFNLDTSPKVVVLDTRTQRWRSESNPNKPSGLMDWEALCEMQQELIDQSSVIMVSPAPVFGVKLIETIQRIFTFFGKPLMVDAENWMAHKGTASVILNVFKHVKTPPNFIILSGDVHYSFVYDVTLRHRKNSPHITQITSSGIKNEFPDKLIRMFDWLNRILYHSKSPLNWFTKRRNMRIKHRRPGNHKIRTLYNGSGIGRLCLRACGKNVRASQISASGQEIPFEK